MNVFQTMMEKLLKLDKKTGSFFSEPVPQNIPGYYDVIKEPMDYGTMRQKLLKGGYRSSQAIQKDFQLVISNCRKFNNSNSDIVRTALKHALQIPNLLRSSAVEHNLFIEEDGTVLEISGGGVEGESPETQQQKKIPKKERKKQEDDYEQNMRKKAKKAARATSTQPSKVKEGGTQRTMERRRFRSNPIPEPNMYQKPKKRIPCKKCPGCLRPECGICAACISKREGGNLKKRCYMRRCETNMNLPNNKTKSKPSKITETNNNTPVEANRNKVKPRIRISLSATPTSSKSSSKSPSKSSSKSPSKHKLPIQKTRKSTRHLAEESSDVEEGEISENNMQDSNDEFRENDSTVNKLLSRLTDLKTLKDKQDSLSGASFKQVRRWVTSLGPWQIPSNKTQSECEILLEMTLDKMKKYDKHYLFAEEVSEQDAPGYFDEIANPIDFGTMRLKIKDNIYCLGSEGIMELFNDYVLIFDNCIKYNGADSDVGREASRVFSYLPVVFAKCYESLFGTVPGKIPKKKERRI